MKLYILFEYSRRKWNFYKDDYRNDYVHKYKSKHCENRVYEKIKIIIKLN